jgi:hypothetical protein
VLINKKSKEEEEETKDGVTVQHRVTRTTITTGKKRENT